MKEISKVLLISCMAFSVVSGTRPDHRSTNPSLIEPQDSEEASHLVVVSSSAEETPLIRSVINDYRTEFNQLLINASPEEVIAAARYASGRGRPTFLQTILNLSDERRLPQTEINLIFSMAAAEGSLAMVNLFLAQEEGRGPNEQGIRDALQAFNDRNGSFPFSNVGEYGDILSILNTRLAELTE